MIGVANPAGAVALVAVAALIALHLWDRRRRVIRVSTLFLWRQLPAAPLERRRRLRPDLAFWLRLAVLLALIASLLRPWTAGPVGPAVTARVIVLDVSASMQTREESETRFATARRRAAALAADSGTTMLLAAGKRPRVALGWTSDATLVRRRLETLDALDVAGDLAPAVGLALAEARARPGTRVTVLTDLPPDRSGVTDDELALVDWIAIGRSDDNTGVAGLSVEAPPFRRLADAGVTVLVRNYASTTRTVTLEARVNATRWTARRVALGPRDSAQVRLAEPPGAGLLTVRLIGDDALAADDVAYGWLPARTPLDVLVVSDGGRLPGVLADLARTVPGGRVATVTSARYAAPDAPTARVVVFDGHVVPGGSATSMLVVEPAPGNGVCPAAKRTDGPAAVVDWEPEHALLAGIGGLQSLAVAAASVLDAVPWGTTVAHAASVDESFPFLVAGEPGGRRTACLAAAPVPPTASTDQLPLVLLTLATLHWLQEGTGDLPLIVPTGIAVPAPVDAAPVDAAGGLRLAGDPPAMVAERVGAFRLGPKRIVLANLLDVGESDVGRDFGRDGAGEWPATRATDLAPVAATSRREHGWMFVLVALAFLAAEWALWTRRSA